MALSKTKMGNQIGVEGLIFTRDGYTLIEKRKQTQRTTWRDKFAQPISLSMKKADVGLNGTEVLGETHPQAEEAIGKMLETHLNGFGLRMGEDYQFDLSRNFLGISRDLLEGGKPNLYFYVVVDYTAKELVQRLEKAAESEDSNVKEENLSRKYYVYPIDAIQVDYNYVMEMDMAQTIRVYRRRRWENDFWGNCSEMARIATEKTKTWYRTKVSKKYKKECGEAFLGCLAYYELCKDRIQAEFTYRPDGETSDEAQENGTKEESSREE